MSGSGGNKRPGIVSRVLPEGVTIRIENSYSWKGLEGWTEVRDRPCKVRQAQLLPRLVHGKEEQWSQVRQWTPKIPPFCDVPLII